MKLKKHLAFPLLILFFAPIAEAQSDRVLRVSGYAEVMADPDQASVRLGVADVAATAADAQQAVNRRIAAVLAAVSEVGISKEKIQTSSISLSPRYRRMERGDEAPEIIGYHASNTITVVVDDLQLVGPVIDAATQAGTNEINGISFELSDRSSAEQKALSLAAEKAAAKAKVLAEALGVQLFGIKEVGESDVSVTPVVQRMTMESSFASTPVSPGQVGVSARVTITYVIF